MESICDQPEGLSLCLHPEVPRTEVRVFLLAAQNPWFCFQGQGLCPILPRPSRRICEKPSDTPTGDSILPKKGQTLDFCVARGRVITACLIRPVCTPVTLFHRSCGDFPLPSDGDPVPLRVQESRHTTSRIARPNLPYERSVVARFVSRRTPSFHWHRTNSIFGTVPFDTFTSR